MVHDYNYNHFHLIQHYLFMNSSQSIYISFFPGIQVINPNALQEPICLREFCLCLCEGKYTGKLPGNVQKTNANHSKQIFLMFLQYVLCLNKSKIAALLKTAFQSMIGRGHNLTNQIIIFMQLQSYAISTTRSSVTACTLKSCFQPQSPLRLPLF